MLRILGLGDNVVDKYLHMNKMYPGGNALNVAVFAQRNGVETGYMGCLGDDFAGRHIYECLIKEGVDINPVKIISGANAYANVTVIDGNRVFIPGNPGVSKELDLTEEDYALIGNYDLVHTSIYSGIDQFLPRISEEHVIVSYDFSDIDEHMVNMDIIQYIDCVFLSASNWHEVEIKAELQRISDCGPTYVIATRGAQGAILLYDGNFYTQHALPTDVVDTLGAGDAFIARFLTGVLQQENVMETLVHAAEKAAEVCTYFGAFGYGVTFADEVGNELRQPI